jgi:hypothetical protein
MSKDEKLDARSEHLENLARMLREINDELATPSRQKHPKAQVNSH